ncbi:type II secretion system protein [Solidesulfovibrio sp.]|jgi:type II secretory pathway pseudopilin PulG|uniref:type II secretion system protein n=1 Tax=Solidesulfovibrio sp. TaxID=2910990 RepID=UPI002B20F0B1|nr:type II secretion system protein [Solidesulfovibrio sp.]MEA4856796.1 type II secretion system protein [Solidesulfovibrio sp.]
MKRRHCDWGFTLLEVIMTFVLFAIVGTVAVSYFTKGITRTDIPVTQLQTDASLQLVLENMIADKTTNTTFNTNLVAFCSNLGTINATQNTYGSGSNYIVTQKDFVCPSANTFVTNSNSNQFLLVTIKPSTTSGVSLTYLFSSTAGNCNIAGGS